MGWVEGGEEVVDEAEAGVVADCEEAVRAFACLCNFAGGDGQPGGMKCALRMNGRVLIWGFGI